jgi:hypothetical protein
MLSVDGVGYPLIYFSCGIKGMEEALGGDGCDP